MNDWLFMPELASAHGGEVDRLMLILHVFMVVFFAGWLAFGLYTLVRFRRRRNPTADYHGTHTHLTHFMEFGVIAFEIALLVRFPFHSGIDMLPRSRW